MPSGKAASLVPVFGSADTSEEVIDFEPSSSPCPVEFQLPAGRTRALASTTYAIPSVSVAPAIFNQVHMSYGR